jgi:hypothetical protein
MYTPTLAITLRPEEAHHFDKFGAVAESDGENMLWISSGWAHEEQGIVWSYNVRNGHSKLRRRASLIFQDDDFPRGDEDEPDIFEIARIFAKGSLPKVLFSRLS